MITVKNLAIQGASLSFTVAHGTITALLGTENAGKSALLDCLTGNTPIAPGQVDFCGHDLASAPLEAKACLGFMPQQPPLYDDLSIRAYLKYIGETRDMGSKRIGERTSYLLELLDLRAVADQPMARLSLGTRRLANLAQALLANPPILILDEPTDGLDAKEVAQLRAVLREIKANHALFLASKIINEVAALADDVILMDGGQILAQGNPQELSTLTCDTDRLHLRIKGDESTVRSAAESIPGHSILSLESSSAFTVELILQPKDNGDALREALFWAMSKAGCPVLEMRLARTGLDAFLLRLVHQRSAAEKEA